MTFVVSNFTGTCISLIHLVAFVGEQIRVSPHSSALLALAVAAIEVLPHKLLVFGYLHSGKKHLRRRII
jgi:hypothetical protein